MAGGYVVELGGMVLEMNAGLCPGIALVTRGPGDVDVDAVEEGREGTAAATPAPAPTATPTPASRGASEGFRRWLTLGTLA